LFLMKSRSSFTGSAPQPKYFWPMSTCTLPVLIRFGAGGLVSNEMTLGQYRHERVLRTPARRPRNPRAEVAIAIFRTRLRRQNAVSLQS
jgi:hypothetical protein